MKEHANIVIRRMLAEGVAWQEYGPQEEPDKGYYSARAPRHMMWPAGHPPRGRELITKKFTNRETTEYKRAYKKAAKSEFLTWLDNLIANAGSKAEIARFLQTDWLAIHRWTTGTWPQKRQQTKLNALAISMNMQPFEFE